MNRFSFWLLRIYTLLLAPMFITLDGSDNTITIGKSLFRILMRLGIEKNNHIYMFRIKDPIKIRYAFCICPDEIDPASTVTAELKYNDHFKTFGFECLCPTIQQIYYHWNITDTNKKHKTVCRPRLTPTGMLYFEILR